MPVSSSFGIKCPGYSHFYSGNTTAAFLGCCTVDPATNSDGLCPDDSLRAATFNPTAYSSIPKQQCAAKDRSALWYVCAYTEPPFMGCCAVSACEKGCAQADLRPAKLSSDIEDANVFLGPSVSTSAAPPSSSSSATATSTASPSSTPVPSNGEHQGMQPAAVAGLAIGTAAVVSMIAILIFWLVRRRRAAAAARHDYALPGGAPEGQCQTSAAASAWTFDDRSAAYSKHLSYASLHRGGGRQSIPPEYSAAAKHSPAPTELPGSATTAVFELHEDTSPPMRSSGFGHR
ncbi:hypothetical protein LMH87_007079 [Akanthomyces muscarius]|uniref:Uncharacterized protein n=1 Tax=Akanthomyces muscarius TaxID=2231603 RepID=A0A9W8US31_AKAMU|nr:hypothetical protein LMH87_007079 [Akanthomyces muscarius]KAJ4165446.1 hypothetical protein LMH87_007079 [Akanthomyces muscarius]